MTGMGPTRKQLLLLCLLLVAPFHFAPASSADDSNPSPTDPTNSATSQSPSPPSSSSLPPSVSTTAPPPTSTTTTTTPVSSTPPPPTTTTPTTTTPTTTTESTTASPSTTTASPTTHPTPAPTTTSSATTPSPATTPDTSPTTPTSTTPTPTPNTPPTAPSSSAPSTTTASSSEKNPTTPISTAAPAGGSSAEAGTDTTPTTTPTPTSVSPDDKGSTTTTITTTVAPTTTPEAPSTRTTPSSAFPTKKPEKPFQLVLEVGSSNDSAIYCVKTDNCTFDAISESVTSAFSTVSGFLYVRKGGGTTQRRKRDTQFSVDVLFDTDAVTGLTEVVRKTQVLEAIQTLGSSSGIVDVNMEEANAVVEKFVTADVCSMSGACPLGYQCKANACHHLCENYDCGQNGVCQATVNVDGKSGAKCVCNSDDDYAYSGDRCQDEAMSKTKVAAILGGVLGTLCAVFLLVIVFLCCRLRGDSDGRSRGKYQFGGHSNNGFADSEFAMKNVASADP